MSGTPAVIEFVELGNPYQPDKTTTGFVKVNAVFINGERVAVAVGEDHPVTIHGVEASHDRDAVMVTLTLFAREVRIRGTDADY